MPEVAVVHLVRAKNGIEPFNTFLESYRRCNGGMEHDLIVLFKGFGTGSGLSEYQLLLKDIPHRSIRLLDYGFDIRAYFVAAKKFTYRYYCFVNSFSVLLDLLWLSKLHACLTRPGIGLVGATGSWESSYTSNCSDPIPALSSLGRLQRDCWLKKLARQFDPFPNYHIRTNGFLASRDVLMKIRTGFLLSKMDAHLFESGKHSLTRQIADMGLEIRIVGRDGNCYAPAEWHRSNTFRSADQVNLLIADNQTRTYGNASAEVKAVLSAYAWGQQSDG